MAMVHSDAKQKDYKTMTGLHARGWRESYLSYLPKRKHRRRILFALVVIVSFVVVVQLAYPRDRGLPLAEVNGVGLRYATYNEMAKTITDQFAASKVTFEVGKDKSVTYALAAVGAEPNTEDMVKQLSEYPLWQRLIPGSILWQPVWLDTASVFYDSAKLSSSSDEISKKLSFPPANARLSIKNGALVATADMAGSTVATNDVARALSGTEVQLGKTTTVNVLSKRTPAARTAQDLQKVRAQAEAVIAHAVTITANDQQFSPTKADIASWVLLSRAANGDVSISIDPAKIKTYLATINSKVGTPAGQTNIDLVDGRETGRTTGVSGRAIDSDELTSELTKQLLLPTQSITLHAAMVDVQPSVIYDHKYTTTQAGLQAYVTDVANSQNMHIVVQQLQGEKWYAAARENESIPSGSTYKLFVASVLFDRIDKGEIHWTDPMLDTTVAGCFDRMTVPSTNPCAESWIAQFGRQYINDFVHARGFSDGTSFTTGSANQTTAADLTKYMIGLNDGTLVSGDNRSRLLYNLSRHPYKYGIATGSVVPDNQVYDKVGFLWDYIHDTAIVMHPKGTYILTIMTKGQSYAAIAAVTREIERIMYP